MSKDLKYRLGGVALLAVALGAAWWGVWLPLQSAKAAAPQVTWTLRIVVLIPLAAVFGLFFLAAGARYPYRNAERKTLTPVGWTLLGIVAVLSLAAFVGMKMVFEQYGYR